ncbi:MAG: CBS domain-containing protein [Gammaproteobacteria bacterium]|nr:CBS domain-containing protein [Gammaproteobacteria bacterium]
MATPVLIAETTVRFLRSHVPFSRMARKDLEFVAERVKLAYFPVGTTIVDPAHGVAEQLHIIQRGHVRVHNTTTASDDEVRGPGECFPVAALAAGTAGARRFEATEDVFCYQLTREDFESLRLRSVPFAEYCTAVLESIVQQSLGQLRQNFSHRAVEQRTLLEPLKVLVRRDPVFCETTTTVREALEAMRQERIGTIAVVDGQRRPGGIFTLTDLMDRVVLPGVDLSASVAEVMTPAPGTLDELATAQEALSLMAQLGYHQLMVTRENRLVGVVSERDLFALQRVTMRNIMQSIRLSRDLTGLQRARRDIDALTDNLIAQGAAAEPLTHTITALNDALADRLFGLLAPRFELDGIDWCWLSVGSEGRREQTVATDQDNAILFDCEAADRDAVRQRLLLYARAANDALAELGFPLCTGDIMARNPDHCLAAEEWRARFAVWIREPTPEALLQANIFFDFRALFGNLALGEGLRNWLMGVTPENRLFQRLLVANALQAEPPLGMIRSFRTDDGEHAGTIDLKTHGTRIFVDAARAFALALGIADTNTAQRLRLAGRRLNIDERETDSAVEAYHFLQMLRLRAQRDALEPDRGDAAERPRTVVNRIDPYTLNDLDKRMLKEAFRQARSLQQRLEQTVGQ